MLAVLAFVATLVAGAPLPAQPTRWVTDNAGMMTPAARQALDARLEGYERTTGHQVVVWIGDTIGDADLADWAVRTFAAWKLGRKGIDDGIGIFVLAKDHKIDIEVGYGLEGSVPDAIAKRAIDEQMAPKLRAGDPDGAINAGVDAILTAIGADAGSSAVPPPPPAQQAQQRGWTDYLGWGVMILVLLVVFGRNPGMLLYLLSGFGGRGGFGGGGFGGGGGGFGDGDGGGGGFSGGGGSSGGGGARGGW